MDLHRREHILIADPLAVRSFLLASSLRRLGLRASVMEPGDAAEDATFFFATYDLGGPERLCALRLRFPYMPIVTYSEDPQDASRARREGADGHASLNAYELAWLVRDYRRPKTTMGHDEGQFGERIIPHLRLLASPSLKTLKTPAASLRLVSGDESTSVGIAQP